MQPDARWYWDAF